jgi:hypothetical protein
VACPAKQRTGSNLKFDDFAAIVIACSDIFHMRFSEMEDFTGNKQFKHSVTSLSVNLRFRS